MYNYISLAQNNGLYISNKFYDKTIKKYYINKENDFIRIEYISGRVKQIPLSKKRVVEVEKAPEDFYNIK